MMTVWVEDRVELLVRLKKKVVVSATDKVQGCTTSRERVPLLVGSWGQCQNGSSLARRLNTKVKAIRTDSAAVAW